MTLSLSLSPRCRPVVWRLSSRPALKESYRLHSHLTVKDHTMSLAHHYRSKTPFNAIFLNDSLYHANKSDFASLPPADGKQPLSTSIQLDHPYSCSSRRVNQALRTLAEPQPPSPSSSPSPPPSLPPSNSLSTPQQMILISTPPTPPPSSMMNNNEMDLSQQQHADQQQFYTKSSSAFILSPSTSFFPSNHHSYMIPSTPPLPPSPQQQQQQRPHRDRSRPCRFNPRRPYPRSKHRHRVVACKSIKSIVSIRQPRPINSHHRHR